MTLGEKPRPLPSSLGSKGVMVKAIRDKNGTLYRVPGYQPKAGKGLPVPEVDVWWNRDPRAKANESLMIRQDNGDRADVIVLTQGQVYDLIHALGLAIVHP